MSDDIFHDAYSDDELKEEATSWWRRAYEAQVRGEIDEAIELYTRSIEICPTAEAYTYRGWAMSYQDRLDEAIEDCHRAIAVDPEFGNPYNDIGAYLIQQGDYYGAIPWLKRALRAKRYECYFYPYFNLGRIYEKLNDLIRAMNHYKAAYEMNHNYTEALKNFRRLQARLS
ncbi:MAG TPA: tetratricopeptide repeat protein [Blastocatellia bacterium]|nr:tetratricopeptide repeat protein [Blastocatellia bacterium]